MQFLFQFQWFSLTSNSNLWNSDTTKHKDRSSGPFALSNRDQIFQKRTENGSIIPHIAFEQQQKFPLEQIFQSLHLLLFDTVSSELKFEKAFFGTYNFFSPLFSKIIDMYLVWRQFQCSKYELNKYTRFFNSNRFLQDWLDTNLKDFWDAVGVLLMMNVVEQVIFVSTRISHTHLTPHLNIIWHYLCRKFLG